MIKRGGNKVCLFAGLVVVMCISLRVLTLPSKIQQKRQINHYKTFSFLQPVGTEYCPDLFPNQSKDMPNPQEYWRLIGEFFLKLDDVSTKGTRSLVYPEEAKVIHRLAGMSGIKQICQIGLQTGYETLLVLMAATTTKVAVFDGGELQHSRTMGRYLKDIFSGRLEIIRGHPEAQIPVWGLGEKNCDFVLIRGSKDKRTLVRDIRAVAKISSEDAVIVMDNYPHGVSDMQSSFIAGGWNAWDALDETGEYRPRMTCSYKPNRQGQAFTVGILTPNGDF